MSDGIDKATWLRSLAARCTSGSLQEVAYDFCGHASGVARDFVCREYATSLLPKDAEATFHPSCMPLPTTPMWGSVFGTWSTKSVCRYATATMKMDITSDWQYHPDHDLSRPCQWDFPAHQTIGETLTDQYVAPAREMLEDMVDRGTWFSNKVSSIFMKSTTMWSEMEGFSNSNPNGPSWLFSQISFEAWVAFFIVAMQLLLLYNVYKKARPVVLCWLAVLSMLVTPYFVGVQMFFTLVCGLLFPYTTITWVVFPIYYLLAFLLTVYQTYWPLYYVMAGVLGLQFFLYYFRGDKMVLESPVHEGSMRVKGLTLLVIFIALLMSRVHIACYGVILLYLVFRWLYVMVKQPLCYRDTYESGPDGIRKLVSHLWVYRGITGWELLDQYINPSFGIGLGSEPSPRQVDEEVKRLTDAKLLLDNLKIDAERDRIARDKFNARDTITTMVNARIGAVRAAERDQAQIARDQANADKYEARVQARNDDNSKKAAAARSGLGNVIPPHHASVAPVAQQTSGQLASSTPASVTTSTKHATLRSIAQSLPASTSYSNDVKPKETEAEYKDHNHWDWKEAAACIDPTCTSSRHARNVKNESPVMPVMQLEAPNPNSPFVDLDSTRDVVRLELADGTFAGTGYFVENRIHTVDHNTTQAGVPNELYGLRLLYPESVRCQLKFVKMIGAHAAYDVPQVWRDVSRPIKFGKMKACPLTTHASQCMIVGIPQTNPFNKVGGIVGSVGRYSYQGQDKATSEYGSDFGMSGSAVYEIVNGVVSNNIIGTHGGTYGSDGNFFHPYTDDIIRQFRPEAKVDPALQQALARIAELEASIRAQDPSIKNESPIHSNASCMLVFEGAKRDRVRKNKTGRGKNQNMAKLATRAAQAKGAAPSGFNRSKFYSTKLGEWVDYGDADKEWSNWVDAQEQQGFYVEDDRYYDIYKSWLGEHYGFSENVQYPDYAENPEFYIHQSEDLSLLHDYASRFSEDTAAWDSRARVGKGIDEAPKRVAFSLESDVQYIPTRPSATSHKWRMPVVLEAPNKMEEQIAELKAQNLAQQHGMEILQKRLNTMISQPVKTPTELKKAVADLKVEQQIRQLAEAIAKQNDNFNLMASVMEEKLKGLPGTLETAIPKLSVTPKHVPASKKGKEKEKVTASNKAEAKATEQVAKQAFSTAGTPSKKSTKRCPYCQFLGMEVTHPPPNPDLKGPKRQSWITVCPNSKPFAAPKTIWNGWSEEDKNAFKHLSLEQKHDFIQKLGERMDLSKTVGSSTMVDQLLEKLAPSSGDALPSL